MARSSAKFPYLGNLEIRKSVTESQALLNCTAEKQPQGPMRFYPDGPDIPSRLLEARNGGELVFFCGAGVSIPSGLPSFLKLTQMVVKSLGASPASRAHQLLKSTYSNSANYLPPLDQVFGELQMIYGRDVVQETVRNFLRTKRKVSSAHHEIVRRLSRNSSGTSRIVTTNFDTLFEGEPRIPIHLPPFLPDIENGEEFDGITYIHGRIDRSNINQAPELILGSEDYGRAYLAEGWATRFARHLLLRHTVCLLGYSADDPPIRYLLEGLRAIPNSLSDGIYAFACGEPREQTERWGTRGVKAINYVANDRDHSNLWQTLTAWADMAENLPAWRSRTAEMARTGPSALAPYQRGQVMTLLGSPEGAQSFGASRPAPPAEWLCTLDLEIRYSKPEEIHSEEGQTTLFDPLELYATDSDPPRSEGSEENVSSGENYLAAFSRHEQPPGRALRLAGAGAGNPDPLPWNLVHLSRWISNVIEQPIAIWWASGKRSFHPVLGDQLERRLRDPSSVLPPAIRHVWRLILECFISAQRRSEAEWHLFQRHAKSEGWGEITLREFERIARPYITCERPPLRTPRDLAGKNFEELEVSQLITFRLRFLAHHEGFAQFPDRCLPTVLSALRQGLQLAHSIATDLGTQTWVRLPTLHPDPTGSERHLDDEEAYFLWFAKLFQRLAETDSDAAIREMNAWTDALYFLKPRLWAWIQPNLASPAGAASGLLSLPDSHFWRSDCSRELLWTLRARWQQFSDTARSALEHRVLEGPSKWEGETEERFNARRAFRSTTLLEWLRLNGCQLGQATLSRIAASKATLSDWRDEWASSADETLETRAAWVTTNSDPAGLLAAPPAAVLGLAEQLMQRRAGEFVENDPFGGLVKSHPSRALSALAFEGRRGIFALRFWMKLLSNWPDSASTRTTNLCAQRLSRLPRESLIELRYYAPSWLRSQREKLPDSTQWELLDAFVDAVCESGSAASQSALRQSGPGGTRHRRSARGFDSAYAGPIGITTDIVITALFDLQPAKGSSLPPSFRTRIGKALGCPGEGKHHAAALLSRQIEFFHWLDAPWTARNLLPLFRTDQDLSEAAWHGLLSSRQVPSPPLLRRLSPALLETFSSQFVERDRSFARRLGEFLAVIVLQYSRKHSFSFQEARIALQVATEPVRVAALHQISVMMRRGTVAWPSVKRNFMDRVWPKELQFQTASTSEMFAEIALLADDCFPEAVRTFSKLLRPVDRYSRALTNLKQTTARRFPTQAIQFLDRICGNDGPIPELTEIVDSIAEVQPALRESIAWRRLHRLAIGP